jgi:hypothetical protein
MNTPGGSLAQRRAHLQMKIAAERGALGRALGAWRQPLAIIDLTLSVTRFTRRHPLAVSCVCAALRLGLFKPLARVARAWHMGRRPPLAVSAKT